MTAICAFAGIGGFLFLNTIYLQESRGYSALRTGLALLPMAAMVAGCAPLSGRLVARRGGRLPLLLAGIGIVASAALLSTLRRDTGIGHLLLAYVLFGMSSGLVNPPITNTAVSGMPRSQAGLAAAVASTSRQIGQSLGVAVIGSAVTSAIHGPLPAGLPQASHVGWWIVAGSGVAVAVLGLLTTGGPPVPPAG